MNFLRDFFHVIIWKNNILLFSDLRLILTIYSVVFLILFLENAILPAIFLPGDSLLIILGILIAKGMLNFVITLGLLTIAVSLGSWISYLQGKFIENNKITQRWLSRIPYQLYRKVNYMFDKYGLCLLFIGRFIAFLRTILPTVAGVSGLSSVRFQLFNWISAFIWVFLLILLGVILERSECVTYFFKK